MYCVSGKALQPVIISELSHLGSIAGKSVNANPGLIVNEGFCSLVEKNFKWPFQRFKATKVET